MFRTINPATEEVIKEYEELNSEGIDAAIEKSQIAFKSWRRTSFSERSKLMTNAGRVLRARREEFARLMAVEMGKPLAQGISEAEKCADCCDYYASNAESQLRDEYIRTEFSKSYVSYQPIGPVLAIMPWNFPFWQVFRFAAPNLMAGNAGLLKHARNTMGSAIAIGEIFLEAGFPPGLFTNLVIGSDKVARALDHPLIAAVTLTGSTPVGSQVAAHAGAHIKKTVLELGGSDPYIVLKDCDLERTVETCVDARLINSGQSCIAAKRFIVERPILSQFEELFTQKMSRRKMGNPLDDGITVGPQARRDLRDSLHWQVAKSMELGAKLLLGGEIPGGKGFYYPPTVLTNVVKGMPVYDEETFGPVAAIIDAGDERQAIEIANDTIFGLGAAIFTSDVDKGEAIARTELHAGACFVNDFVRSDSRLPFGGTKQSGYGRELSSFGIKEFVNIKTVCVS